MKKRMLPAFFLFLPGLIFSQRTLYQQSFNDVSLSVSLSSEDVYTLKIESKETSFKVKSDQELLEFLTDALDKRFPASGMTPKMVVSFEALKISFPKNVIEGRDRLKEINKRVQLEKLPGGYLLSRVLGNDLNYYYYLENADSRNQGSVEFFKKGKEQYEFDLVEIQKQEAFKQVLTANLLTVYDAIEKDQHIKMPGVSILGEEKNSKPVFKLVFTYPDDTKANLDISGEQVTAITGQPAPKIKKGSVEIPLREKKMPEDEEEKEDKAEKVEEPGENKTDPATSKSAAAIKVTEKEILLNKRVYIIQLWTKEEKYYLQICGAAILAAAGEGAGKSKPVKMDTCITNPEKILSLASNDDNFKQLFDNTVSTINNEVDQAAEEYKTTRENTYVYFSAEETKRKTAEKSKMESEKITKEVKQRMKEIDEEEEHRLVVGRLVMQKTAKIRQEKRIENGQPKKMKSYSDNKGKGPSFFYPDGSPVPIDEPEINMDIAIGDVNIDSVKITIDNGTIARRGIFVFTSQGIFTNKLCPISLQRFDKRFPDRLVPYDERDGSSYMEVGDVLQYIPMGRNYIPDDVDDLLLTPGNNEMLLYASSNFKNLLNVNIYTDLAGLLGRRANGLIQTDVSAKVITNTGNIRNLDCILLNFIEGKVTLAKYDSKFRQLDSAHIRFKNNPDEKDTVDRSFLNQIPWLRGEVKINAARIRIGPNQYLYLNCGAQIGIVNGDSVYVKEVTRNKDIIFFNYTFIPEVVFVATHLGNFSFECSVKWMHQRLALSGKFSNSEWQKIFTPQVLFSYHPFKKPDSRIYLRFNYYDNLTSSENNFYQLQFGWKTTLKISK